jgi:hypothetical protein
LQTDFGRLSLWWDTGSPTSLLSTRFTEHMPRLVSGDIASTQTLDIDSRQFGPWQFQVIRTSLPRFADGIIGFDFFASHVVCFDFPHRQLRLQ